MPDGQITAAARANSARVPDAVQRPSRCSAEPGPISTLRDGPVNALMALRGIRGTSTGRVVAEGVTRLLGADERRITPSAQSVLRA